MIILSFINIGYIIQGKSENLSFVKRVKMLKPIIPIF